MVKREIERLVLETASTFPAVAVMGPRQCGKTTLAKACFPRLPYVTLEDPDVRRAASSDPRYFLGRYADGAVLDEIQNAPELMSYLQGVVDAEPERMGRFVLTGSRQFSLMESMTQSLAGRIGILTMTPFTWGERYGSALASVDVDEMILEGLYPPVSARRVNPRLWYASYFQTYLERDVRQILKVKELAAFELFMRLLAGRTGQELNLNSLGIDAGVSHTTAKAWLGVLETSGLVFLLPPYFRNFNKRLVKSPKIYFADTGLACWLMGIETAQQLHSHPLYGAVFETAVVSELRKRILNGGRLPNLYYWRDNARLEVDIIEDTPEGPRPLEIKSGQTYREEWARGIRRWTATAQCPAERARIVYGGKLSLKDGGVSVLPWCEL